MTEPAFEVEITYVEDEMQRLLSVGFDFVTCYRAEWYGSAGCMAFVLRRPVPVAPARQLENATRLPDCPWCKNAINVEAHRRPMGGWKLGCFHLECPVPNGRGSSLDEAAADWRAVAAEWAKK